MGAYFKMQQSYKINAFGHDRIISISYSYADRLWKLLDEPVG